MLAKTLNISFGLQDESYSDQGSNGPDARILRTGPKIFEISGVKMWLDIKITTFRSP